MLKANSYPSFAKTHSLKALHPNWLRMAGGKPLPALWALRQLREDLLSSGCCSRTVAGLLADSGLFPGQDSVLEQWHPFSSTEEEICCAVHFALAANLCSCLLMLSVLQESIILDFDAGCAHPECLIWRERCDCPLKYPKVLLKKGW